MSDWMREGNTLRVWNYDSGYEIELEWLPETEGFRLAVERYQGKYDEEKVKLEGYLHGRNLEVFREWLNQVEEA